MTGSVSLGQRLAARRRNVAARFETLRRRVVGRVRGRPIVHFIHVGKTGGVAMKQTLRSCLGVGRYTLFVHGHAQTLRQVPPGEKIVFFLRDPISKFVSGFYYRQRQARPHFDIPWRPDEALAFGRFASPNALALALSDEDPTRRDEAVHAMRHIHQVKDSVFRWFESEAYFRSRIDDVLFVGFQEELDRDFEQLKKILGLPDTLLLPGPDASAYQKTSGVDRSLDPAAIANLDLWYERDIQFYQLCRTLRQGTSAAAS